MASQEAPLPASVIVVNHNGVSFLGPCLESLRALDPPAAEVIVVDNASDDGSVPFVRSHHPWVRLVEAGENLGYCGGNNLGILHATQPYVALLNNDTTVEPGWLAQLLAELEAHPEAAACSSLVLLPGDPPRVHYAGSEAHVLGHIANLHYLRPLASVERELRPCETGVYVGSSVLFRRGALDDVGLLEERFFIYEDELDLSLRLRMKGWTIRWTPRSVVWHFTGTPGLAVRTRQAYPPRRAFLVTRNRWLVIARLYQVRTILLLLPLLVGYEGAWWVAMLRRKCGRQVIEALGWNWRNRRWVLHQRRMIQATRTVGDPALMSSPTLSPVPGLADKGVGYGFRRAGESLVALYWSFVRRLL